MTDFYLKMVNGKTVGKLLKKGIDSSDGRGAACLYLGLSYLFALSMISEKSYSEILFVLAPLIQNHNKSAFNNQYKKLWEKDGFSDFVIQTLIHDYEKRGITFANRKYFKEFLFSFTYLTIPIVNKLLLDDRLPLGKENENSFIKFYGNKVYFLKPTFHAYDFYEMESNGEQHVIARGISNLKFDFHTLKVDIEYGAELKECYGIYDLEKGNKKVKNEPKAYPHSEQESIWNRLLYELISCVDMYWYISYLKKDGKISTIDGAPELAARRRMQIANYITEPRELSLTEIEKKVNLVMLIDKYNEEAVFILKEFLTIIQMMGYGKNEDLSNLFNALFRCRDLLFSKYEDIPVFSTQFMKSFLPAIKNRTDIKTIIERGDLPLDNYDDLKEKPEEEYMVKKYVGWFHYQDNELQYERYLIEQGIAEWEYTIAPINKDNYCGGVVKFNRNTRLFLIECEKLSPELLKGVMDSFGLQYEDYIAIKDQEGERVISSEDYLSVKNESRLDIKEELPFN